MKLRATHMSFAFLLAILLQAAAAWLIASTLLSNRLVAQHGATHDGEDGLTIGLGLAGSFDTQRAAQALPLPEPEPRTETITETPDHDSQEQQPEEILPETLPEQPEKIVAETPPIPEIQTGETAHTRAQSTELAHSAFTEPPPVISHQSNVEKTSPHTPTKSTSADASPQSTPAETNSTANTQATGTGNTVSTGGTTAEQQSYLARLLAHAARFKRYPRSARQDGVTGTVHVRFHLAGNGRVKRPVVLKSSGDQRLDQAAVEVILRANPFPAIPKTMSKDGLDLTLPIEFSLNARKKLF